jgi:hypothetical protein
MATTDEEVAKKKEHVSQLRQKIRDERRKNVQTALATDNDLQLARLKAEEDALNAELKAVQDEGKETAKKAKDEVKVVADTPAGEPVVVTETPAENANGEKA